MAEDPQHVGERFIGPCMIVLRKRSPDLPRVFRCPQPYLVGTLAILGCLYLLFSLPSATLIRFVAWNVIGIVAYLLYGRSHSMAAKNKPVVGI